MQQYFETQNLSYSNKIIKFPTSVSPISEDDSHIVDRTKTSFCTSLDISLISDWVFKVSFFFEVIHRTE